MTSGGKQKTILRKFQKADVMREEEEDEENEDEAGRARTCETTKTNVSLNESDVLERSSYFRPRQTWPFLLLLVVSTTSCA